MSSMYITAGTSSVLNTDSNHTGTHTIPEDRGESFSLQWAIDSVIEEATVAQSMRIIMDCNSF